MMVVKMMMMMLTRHRDYGVRVLHRNSSMKLFSSLTNARIEELKSKENSEVVVKLKRGHAGKTQKQRKILEALRLYRINEVGSYNCTPSILGMLKKVSHLVSVEEQDEYEERLRERKSSMSWRREIVISHEKNEK